MTADFEQPASDLPEAIRSLGEGPAGEAFRKLYADMVDEFTPEEISQIIVGDLGARKARAAADWRANLEAEGWTVLTSPTPLRTIFERPSTLSEVEKLQAAARPIRYSGLPDDFILVSPNRLTLDSILREKLLRIRHEEIYGSSEGEPAADHEDASSDQLAAFELLSTDEEAAAALRKDRKSQDTIAITRGLWSGVKDILELPGLRSALVRMAEQDGVRSDWYAEDLDWILQDMEAQEVVQELEEIDPAESGFAPIPAHPGDARLTEDVRKLLGDSLKLSIVEPQQTPKSDNAEPRVLIDEIWSLVAKRPEMADVDAVLKDAEEHQPAGRSQEKEASASYSVLDILSDYSELNLALVSAYIQSYGHRFTALYSDLAQILNGEDFSDRDRLVMVLGALEGHEQNGTYGYHISRIRQILKRH